MLWRTLRGETKARSTILWIVGMILQILSAVTHSWVLIYIGIVVMAASIFFAIKDDV